jgi:chromosome partitioning protein
VLNAIPPRASQILADAREAVAVHGLEVAPIALRQRVAYAHALTAGQTAQEYEPKGQATDEIFSFYQWLCGILQSIA